MPRHTDPTTNKTTEWNEEPMFDPAVYTLAFDTTPEGLERAADFLLGYSERCTEDAFTQAEVLPFDQLVEVADLMGGEQR
jgi:hypothetical protein